IYSSTTVQYASHEDDRTQSPPLPASLSHFHFFFFSADVKFGELAQRLRLGIGVFQHPEEVLEHNDLAADDDRVFLLTAAAGAPIDELAEERIFRNVGRDEVPPPRLPDVDRAEILAAASGGGGRVERVVPSFAVVTTLLLSTSTIILRHPKSQANINPWKRPHNSAPRIEQYPIGQYSSQTPRANDPLHHKPNPQWIPSQTKPKKTHT
ncbi:Unknown protein, partial [Striga hermonthica]